MKIVHWLWKLLSEMRLVTSTDNSLAKVSQAVTSKLQGHVI